MNQSEKDTPTETPEFPIIGDPSLAPTIFVDGFQGLSIVNDVAKITMFQVVQDVREPELPLKRVVVGRLAMSPASLVQLLQWLQNNVKVEKTTSGPK